VWALKTLEIVVKRRRFIIVNTLIVTILAVAISLLLPKKYLVTTTILPPESMSGLPGLAGLTTGEVAAAVSSFSLPFMASPSDLYASMLESETILKQVADTLNLKSHFDTESAWDAVSVLRDNLKIKVEHDGIISIQVTAPEPELAAKIANALTYELDRLNTSIRKQKGRDYSSFLIERLEYTSKELAKTQDDLLGFQKEHMAVSLELQSEALLNNLSQQKAALTTAEIELEMLKRTRHPENPDVISKKIEVSEIRKKLREIEAGASSGADSVISALDLPLSEIPDLSLRFAVLRRNVKIQELIYEMLSQQLEYSRLQERRDTPTISVLDVARPPGAAIYPRKRLIVTVAFVLGFLTSILLAVFSHFLLDQSIAHPKNFARIQEILSSLRKRPIG